MKSTPAKDFSTRLIKACDDSQNIPDYGSGRQSFVADKLSISQEAVRKWFKGLSMPTRDKMKALADLLNVDHTWLALGVTSDLDKNARRFAGLALEGSVLIAAGMVQVNGGIAAFAPESDEKAEYVDFYAILRGHKYDIHVCRETALEDGAYELIIPRDYAKVTCLAMFPIKSNAYAPVLVPNGLIETYKVRKGAGYALKVTNTQGKYLIDGHELPLIKLPGFIF